VGRGRGGGGRTTKGGREVEGVPLSQAESQMTQAGLKYTVQHQSDPTVAKDIVIKTNPPNGNVVPAGTKVTIVVSSGPKMVEVPNVKHHNVGDAESILRSDGVQVNEQTAS